MDVSWVYMELQYKYCQFVRLKLQLIHHWKMLNNKARLFYGVSLCCGASVAGYMVYIYFEKKERELKSKFTKDLFETASICKRRKKGMYILCLLMRGKGICIMFTVKKSIKTLLVQQRF